MARWPPSPPNRPFPPQNLVIALNDILPASIRVLEAVEVPAEFHARKSARAKTYRYTIFRGDICPPFRARYVWHYPYPLDEACDARGSRGIVGEHDFTSFRRGRSGARTRRPGFGSPAECPARFSVPTWRRRGRRFDLYHPRKLDSCTTWCAIWWERFFWRAKARSKLPTCREFLGTLPFGCGSHRAGKWLVPGKRRILMHQGDCPAATVHASQF